MSTLGDARRESGKLGAPRTATLACAASYRKQGQAEQRFFTDDEFTTRMGGDRSPSSVPGDTLAKGTSLKGREGGVTKSYAIGIALPEEKLTQLMYRNSAGRLLHRATETSSVATGRRSTLIEGDPRRRRARRRNSHEGLSDD